MKIFTRVDVSRDSAVHAEDLLTMVRQQQREIEMAELPLSVFALAGGTIGEVKFGPKNREGLDIEVET